MEHFNNFYSAFVAVLGLIYASPWGRKFILQQPKLSNYIKRFDFAILILSILVILFGYFNSVLKEKHQGISVSPEYQIIPPVCQEFTVVITNNLPYAVFNVQLQLDKIEGELNMERVEIYPYESDQNKYSMNPFSVLWLYGPTTDIVLLKEIAPSASNKYLIKIDASSYSKKSKIKIYISHYSEVQMPFYSVPVKPDKNGRYIMPESLKIPDGLEQMMQKK